MKNNTKLIAIILAFVFAIPCTFYLLSRAAGSRALDKDEVEIEAEWNAISKSTQDKVLAALKSVMHIGSKVEIGVNRPDYSTAIAEAHATFKLLEPSAELKDIPKIMSHLNEALSAFRLAGVAWETKSIHESSKDLKRHSDYERALLKELIGLYSEKIQLNWEKARVSIAPLSHVILK